MRGSVVLYFFAAIFCVGTCSTLLIQSQDPIKETQAAGRAEISINNVERKYSSENCHISAAPTHNYSVFLLSLLACEVEETDDEKEVSDLQDERGNLTVVRTETKFLDFLRQSNHVSSIPLFIFLHSWKHFLS